MSSSTNLQSDFVFAKYRNQQASSALGVTPFGCLPIRNEIEITAPKRKLKLKTVRNRFIIPRCEEKKKRTTSKNIYLKKTNKWFDLFLLLLPTVVHLFLG